MKKYLAYCNSRFYYKGRGKNIKFPLHEYKGIEKSCPVCNKFFITKSHNHKYCSRDCCDNFWRGLYKKLQGGIITTGNGEKWNYYKLRFEIFKRDNFTCQYCGRNVMDDGIKLRCDHIIPVAKGGKSIKENLITSCEECNLGKRDVLLNEHLIEKIKWNKIRKL